jgi:hypothetical protein
MPRRDAAAPAAWRFHCPPAVAWVVEQTGLTLLNRETGQRCALPYPQAALWDLLGRARGAEQLGEAMAAVIGAEPTAAEAWIEETVLSWLEDGWLVEE